MQTAALAVATLGISLRLTATRCDSLRLTATHSSVHFKHSSSFQQGLQQPPATERHFGLQSLSTAISSFQTNQEALWAFRRDSLQSLDRKSVSQSKCCSSLRGDHRLASARSSLIEAELLKRSLAGVWRAGVNAASSVWSSCSVQSVIVWRL